MKIKKMNKMGFTLMEIVLVVAIIVILTGLVGGLTISQIKEYQEFNEYAHDHFGENWEKEARLAIDNMMKHPDDSSGGDSSGEITPPADPRIAIDAQNRAKREELIANGVPEENIHCTYDDDGYMTGITWGSDTGISGGGNSHHDVDPDDPKDPTPTPKPTATPTPVPTNTPTPVPTNTNIQPGTTNSGTNTEATPDNGSGYASSQIKLNDSVKNAKTLTITFTYTGTVDRVENFGALGDHAPAVNISNGTITLTFDVAGMADWQKGNLMNLDPQFRSNNNAHFTVQLTGVETT